MKKYKTLIFLMNFILGRPPKIGEIKSVCNRIKKQYFLQLNTKDIFLDRVKLFLHILIFPFKFSFNLNKSKAKIFIYDIEKKDIRKRFVQYYRQKEGQNLDLKDIEIFRSNEFYYNDISVKTIFFLIKIWVIFLGCSFFSFFDRTSCSYLWLLCVLNNIANAIFTNKGVSELYFSYLYNIQSYFSVLLISNILENQIYLISGNSMLYTINRYTSAEKCNFILCSKYQEEEANNFINLHWIKVKSIKLWGLDGASFYEDLKPQNFLYDVGIYSSVSWARVDGVWRANDIKAIKNYKYIKNERYANFLKILDEIIELKKKTGIKVKFYLHPFERYLYKVHKIKPPYFSILVKEGIAVDFKDDNSIKKMYEAKVGVTLCSTIIFDRLHYGLEGFIYAEWPQHKMFNPKFMGKYQANIFYNFDELQAKIKKAL
ncbi:hypothetical protein HOC37_01795 [bacterium]|jgi:hypothetical protein|nr:hypothetical protein [bacterium]MBT3581947.1 hypothetical protein [bacterium]MBT4551700.1 hypothetical protein [bacterium]